MLAPIVLYTAGIGARGLQLNPRIFDSAGELSQSHGFLPGSKCVLYVEFSSNPSVGAGEALCPGYSEAGKKMPVL